MIFNEAELEQRRANLAAKQAAMKQQMLEEGSHLFCGRKYYNSSHGSAILRPIINKANESSRSH